MASKKGDERSRSGGSKRLSSLHERRAAQTRQEILAEARRLLGLQGFEATTMDQIARALNIRRATLYNYFPSKDDLVRECIESTTATLLASPVPATDGSLPEDLMRFFESSHRQLTPDDYRFSFRLMVSPVSAQARATVDSGYAQAHTVAVDILRRARDRAEIGADVDLDHLADDMMAEFIGLSMLFLHDPARFPYLPAAKRAVERIVAQVTPSL